MTSNNVSDADSSATPPLASKRILITRAPRQASELADRLTALGATSIVIPTIEIGPPVSFAALDAAVLSLASFDLVAFTSANAVRAFDERVRLAGVTQTPRRIAAVGPATARSVEAIGLRVDILPTVFTAESLARTLLPEASGHRILLVLAEQASATLESALESAGAYVTVAAAYQNRIPATSLPAMTSLFADAANYPDAVTFTSASTAVNLVALLDAAGLMLPATVARISIGPITSSTLVELGLPPHVEATESTISALVAAVATYFRAGGIDCSQQYGRLRFR